MTQTLQTVLNRFLNHSPHYLHFLEEIAGASIALKITNLPFAMTFTFQHTFIEVSDGVEATAKLFLCASLADFICFAAQKHKRQKLLQEGRVSFQGDLMTLKQLEAFLNHFNWQVLSWLPYSRVKQFLTNQIEYWQEERQVLVSPVLWDHFKDEVLSLQQEFDRLDQRVTFLNDK